MGGWRLDDGLLACGGALVEDSPAGSFVRVQIEDNGCGLPDKPDAKSGDGMSNMRMRLIRMGGCCDVESADGKGTKVEFAVPLSDAGQNGKETAAHLSGNNGDEVR